ncbi:hypothetical protein B0T10DRAFT_111808 [Thelonectria olida]|uniref:Nucleolar protein 12 n=1 Tax=Thelonectria olida TaxID=1576542 RepID=A0A9P8WGL1_9HYPO|nr:hypothetical protein B0T10DRAFT_111808 [Thelonectria olida]
MAKGAKKLTASSKSVDPTLDALFSSSVSQSTLICFAHSRPNQLQAGPVQAPPTSRYSALLEKKPRDAPKPRVVVEDDEDDDEDDDEEGDDEELSEISEELSYEEDEDDDSDDSDDESKDDASEQEEEADEAMADAPVELDDVIEAVEGEKPKKDRKRKRKDENEGLEDQYMSKLTAEEPAEKRQKGDAAKAEGEVDDASSDDEKDAIPVHESLAKDSNTSDLEKAGRTVFLANVSTEAISSKTAKKTLMAHLSSILDKDATPPQIIESIRFRSVAFAGGSLPKRAAYITKSLMEATTKSANAYVVYPSNNAAREAATKLNGTVVLGRHLRVDSVAHPSATDHRRCVFVGNLGFVDDESVLAENKEGETEKKKRNKVPSDIEEGLWRTFSKIGKVENVRVVRDPKTRVGKGFAYVQFYDGNDVEAALHLNDKKFPPLLPRKLRVTRAKDPRKTNLAAERSKAKSIAAGAASKSTKYKVKATPEQQSMAGRTGKLLGRSAAFQQRRGKRLSTDEAPEPVATIKTPEQIVFEGRRASAKDSASLKPGKKAKKTSGRPQNRGAKRAAEWRKST